MQTDGVNLWRQIAETLTQEIGQDVFTAGARLPSAPDLAARFGVNRHTVLRALGHLQDEGLIRIERGRGAYVVHKAIPYSMGARTRFEENLHGLNKVPGRMLISVADLPASKSVAAGLSIQIGEQVTMVTLLGDADGIPLSYGKNYFPKTRLPEIREVFRQAGADTEKRLSITACLAAVGITDFRRTSVRIRSRQPNAEEAKRLQISMTESVLELSVTNVDQNSVPVMYAVTCFSSSRVEFVMDM
ncbi:phosphonate metabolism transcriptional regulator PhnF [Agrobacterium tumefaciens]|uniref:phosphonate metabolism transcriptional regulator PhnF n=1 Tax=Agrobacterium tumefaciens TaxID=358 RepID=UPI001573C6AC|nr:phosphonate metabolism transcriptional regulator PhnF [Agrobacterium tumefaciens]NTE68067.1 phosphonate metabolism transcriptional regulator PhnF [Agrobacterium tumefaciens]